MRILLKNGKVMDPGKLDDELDILIEDGRIVEVGPRIDSSGYPDEGGPTVIDAAGKVIVPGLIDMHVHLREPGLEYKESIESGCRAAVSGGFTAICTMPNTQPVNDNSQVTRYILKKAEMAGTAQVYPVGAISVGSEGTNLCEYADLKEAGVVALSDDGGPVVNSELLRRSMEYARIFSLPIISHCEDVALVAKGVMNEGAVATQMGLAGIPNVAESIGVMRDIALCELTRSPLHIAHVSTGESIHIIREAKSRGVPVTAETAPHYFTLTDEAVRDYNTHAKMNPPLRSEKDRQAILEGLSDGTIDVIATDHAPQTSIEKEMEFDRAANGIIGLETAVPLCLNLVETGILTLSQLIEKMSVNPGRIIGCENRIESGYPANLTVLDTEKPHTIEADGFKSLSRNTPFDQWKVKGKAVLTLVNGTVVYQEPD